MARYQLTLAYDGTHFFGFQRQGKQRTVQLELEAVLRQLGWQGKSLLAAGRTDSGVHASGQVVAFDLEWSHAPDALGRALNANLPPDLAVMAVKPVDAGFHPRYDALSRRYQYHIYCSTGRDPLRERYAWRIWPPADLDRLNQAGQLLAGRHDFAAFGTPPRVGGSTIREVFFARWELHAGCLLFEVCANAFLYHMVRRMVYLQVQVAQGRLELDQLALAVEQAQPQTPGLAPPNGLVLTEVKYASGEQEAETYQRSTCE